LRGADKKRKHKQRRTAIRNAIAKAILQHKLGQFDSLVIISDGGENASSEKEGDLKEALQGSRVRVFVFIAPSDEQSPMPSDMVAVRALSELALGTGGMVIAVNRPLSGAFVAAPSKISVVRAGSKDSLLKLGEYMARRIPRPYLMTLELAPATAGKLNIDVDGSFGRRSGLKLYAPERLLAVTQPDVADPANARP
jgi:hypothetical protein